MEYDPLKKKIRDLIRNHPSMRKLLFKGLDIVLLRSWYIKRMLRKLPLDRNATLSILDAGSGFGQYAYQFTKRYPDATVLGLDIEKEHIEDVSLFAEKSGLKNLYFEVADLTKLEYNSEFDLILTVDVMEHIEKDEELLKVFYNALKPQGHLVISTPSIYRKHCDDGDFVDEHFRDGYAHDEMQDKCTRAGFKNINIQYGYGFWGDLSWRLGIRNTLKLSGWNKFGKLLASLYYLILFPFNLLFMILDFISTKSKGTGMVVHAVKK